MRFRAFTLLGLGLLGGISTASAQTPPLATMPGASPTPQPLRLAQADSMVESRQTAGKRPVARQRTAKHIRRTRTSARESLMLPPITQGVPGPDLAGPAYPPPYYYPPPLYDVAPPPPVVPPPAVAGPGQGAPFVPTYYRYVYEPDRILIVDPYTNIAVQAIPR